MKLLLDTHLLVWAAQDPPPLSEMARRLMDDSANQLWFSAVSIWEIAIKQALGRSNFYLDARVLRSRLMGAGYSELSLTSEHGLSVATLPLIHHDPFDRILIAQAISEGMTLLTADTRIAQYSGPIRKV